MTLASVIPKVHLHCHLEGSLRAATFVELAGRHGVPLRYDPAGPALRGGEPDPADPYRFADFREFLWTFAAVSRALADPDDYARLAREFVEDALAQNVIYGELFVSPSVWTFFNPELDVRAAFANDCRRTALGRIQGGVSADRRPDAKLRIRPGNGSCSARDEA